MGKKYTPSGYRIINIDLSERTNEPFTPETPEEKEIFDILSKEDVTNEKPILLSINTSNYTVVGFATLSVNNLSLIVSDVVSERIRLENNDKLQLIETEF